MKLRAAFKPSIWPYLLVVPQIAAIGIFIFWPAMDAIWLSFFRGDAFGISSHFVGLANYTSLFHDSTYLNSVSVTLIFSCFVTVTSMGFALLLAVLVERITRGRGFYNTLMIWPYAVAPAIAGMLWRFLFSPSVGIVTFALAKVGIHWNFNVNATQALLLVILASAWQQFSYNFVFFVAGLKAIPHSLHEAAAIDGASPFRRFWNVTFPLLSPTTFFLVVMNLVYAFFNTFGVIQVVTQGGPANATNILVYRVYRDGFVGLNFGSSSAQSVIMMILVAVLTVIQFKYVERRVHYS